MQMFVLIILEIKENENLSTPWEAPEQNFPFQRTHRTEAGSRIHMAIRKTIIQSDWSKIAVIFLINFEHNLQSPQSESPTLGRRAGKWGFPWFTGYP